MAKLLCMLLCAGAWTVPAMAQQRLTVERAVELALARNLDIQALESETRAADARVRESALLFRSNPELSGGLGTRLQEGPDSLAYEAALTQELEVFGQRGARADAANESRGASLARVAARRQELIANVRQAFVRSLAADDLVASADGGVALARQTLGAAERRVELGDSPRIELNAARVEVGRALRTLALSRSASAYALANLRTLLAVRPGTELSLEGNLRTPIAIPKDKLSNVKEAFRARAERNAALHDLRTARAEQVLEDREWLPRPRVGVSYEHKETHSALLGTLSFQLPVFNRNAGARGVAAARQTQAELAMHATELRIEQEVVLGASKLAHAQEAVEAFEGQVVDALQESLRLGLIAYEAGKIGFFELLLIRRDALEAQRSQIEALRDLRESEIDLAKALGLER